MEFDEYTEEDVVSCCRTGNKLRLIEITKTDYGRKLLNARDKIFGWSPLFRTVIANRQGMVGFLIEHGADPNIQTKEGDTPLHYTCSNNQYKNTEILLKNNAKTNILNLKGESPLHCACSRGHLGICDLLLHNNADPNLQNSLTGDTPLHIAFDWGHTEIAQSLISLGGNIEIKNFEGKTPSELASKIDIKRIKERLSSKISSPCSSINWNDSKGIFDRSLLEGLTKNVSEIGKDNERDKSSDISRLNPLIDFQHNKTQSIYLSSDEYKNEIIKYSSLNSEKIKNLFNTNQEEKIVLNPETINENSELCNQEDDSLDNTFSREIEVAIDNEESAENIIEFNVDSVKPSYASNEKISNFNSNNTKSIKAYEEAKSMKEHESGQNSSKNKSLTQKYYTVGDCDKPANSEKQESLNQEQEDLVYSYSSFRNNSKSFKANKNLIIDSCDNNGFIYASNSSFISMKTIDKKNEINVHNFEIKREDTEATNFSKSLKVDSKLCSPLQFSSEFLRDKSQENLEKFNHSALRNRYSSDKEKPNEEVKDFNSIPFRIEGSKGNSADLVYLQNKETKTLKSFDSCINPSKTKKKKAKSCGALMNERTDSLNDICYFDSIMHKSSTDLPVFLQYENLEAETKDNEPIIFNSAPCIVIDQIQLQLSADEIRESASSFKLSNVFKKISGIKHGFDSENLSSESEKVESRKPSHLLHTIIEQDTEEERTEIRDSELNEELLSILTNERTSNVYLNNMNSIKFRKSEKKNPFTSNVKPKLEEIKEQYEVPDEEGISDFQSLDAPKLIFKNKKELITGAVRGSECYCCCIKS